MSVTLIPAVLYLRMSSDRQDTSIADQRKHVLAYAKANGYKVIAEYVDEGISGWRNDRESFQRLITDAEQGKFKAVLCWDQDRFSRFPPLEANYYWFRLDQAGVHLTTVAQGRINWNDLAGWLTASISQHAKAEYCRDLARNVARGQRESRLAGKWMTTIPYGYKKANGRLVLGDAGAIETIRRIFRMRAEGIGFKTIAATLNKEGVKSPRGTNWSHATIRVTLTREVYLGQAVIGKYSRGKYARCIDGLVVIDNNHPAIIDRALWDAVQLQNTKSHRKHHHGDGEGAPLAGMVYCANCGAKMYSQHSKAANHKRYICSSYQCKGECGLHTLSQEPFHDLIYSKLREAIGADDLPRLRAIVERKVEEIAAKATPAIDAKGVRKQIATINRKISNATDLLVSVDANLVPEVQKKLLSLQQERSSLEAKLAEPAITPALSVDKIMASVDQFAELLKRGRPAEIRRKLSTFVERISVKFEEWKKTPDGRVWRRPVSGTIKLSNGETLSGLCLPIGTLKITLNRSELAKCYREFAWNSKANPGGHATAV